MVLRAAARDLDFIHRTSIKVAVLDVTEAAGVGTTNNLDGHFSLRVKGAAQRLERIENWSYTQYIVSPTHRLGTIQFKFFLITMKNHTLLTDY